MGWDVDAPGGCGVDPTDALRNERLREMSCPRLRHEHRQIERPGPGSERPDLKWSLGSPTRAQKVKTGKQELFVSTFIGGLPPLLVLYASVSRPKGFCNRSNGYEI